MGMSGYISVLSVSIYMSGYISVYIWVYICFIYLCICLGILPIYTIYIYYLYILSIYTIYIYYLYIYLGCILTVRSKRYYVINQYVRLYEVIPGYMGCDMEGRKKDREGREAA